MNPFKKYHISARNETIKMLTIIIFGCTRYYFVHLAIARHRKTPDNDMKDKRSMIS